LLVLRLARTGRRNQPKYRLVVAENSKPIDGKVVEVVGHYNPTDLNKPLVLDKEVISAWITKGAKPSNTVAKLLNKEGFDLPVHLHPVRPAKKASKEPSVTKVMEDGTESAPVVRPAEPANEEMVAEIAPVEETPVEVVAEKSTSEPVAETEPVTEVTLADQPEAQSSEVSTQEEEKLEDEGNAS